MRIGETEGFDDVDGPGRKKARKGVRQAPPEPIPTTPAPAYFEVEPSAEEMPAEEFPSEDFPSEEAAASTPMQIIPEGTPSKEAAASTPLRTIPEGAPMTDEAWGKDEEKGGGTAGVF